MDDRHIWYLRDVIYSLREIGAEAERAAEETGCARITEGAESKERRRTARVSPKMAGDRERHAFACDREPRDAEASIGALRRSGRPAAGAALDGKNRALRTDYTRNRPSRLRRGSRRARSRRSPRVGRVSVSRRSRGIEIDAMHHDRIRE